MSQEANTNQIIPTAYYCYAAIQLQRLFFESLASINAVDVEAMARPSSIEQPIEHSLTGNDSDDEVDLLFDALTSIDRKLNSIDVNTRQCEDEHRTIVRPNTDVVIVYLQITISSIEDVDTVKQEFTCQFYLGVNWEEPLLKDDVKEGKKIDWEECWDPRIYFQNAVEMTSITSSRKIIHPRHDEDPSVQIAYRVKGRFKTIFDLRKFPYDNQRLQIHIVSKWSDTVVQFKESRFRPGRLSCKTFLCEHEWELHKHVIGTESCTADDCTNDHSLSLGVKDASQDAQCRHRMLAANMPPATAKKGIIKKTFIDERPLTFSVFTFSFIIDRKFSFFISNVVVLLALICLLSLGPFCVAQSETGDRLSIIFTLLLTAVTFKFVVSQSLPKVSYQTLLDMYVFICIVYIFFVSLIIGMTTRVKFFQVREQYTVVLIFVVWLSIILWFIGLTIFIRFKSSGKLKHLENVIHSRYKKAEELKGFAKIHVRDVILPKLSPNSAPLRISESTASAAFGQRSIFGSHAILRQNRIGERRSTLANIRMKKRNLKLKKEKKNLRKVVLADVLSDGADVKPDLPTRKNASMSSSSSSSSSEGMQGEIVLGRYTASFDDQDEISDNSSESGEVFTHRMNEKQVAKNTSIILENKAGTIRRSSNMKG